MLQLLDVFSRPYHGPADVSQTLATSHFPTLESENVMGQHVTHKRTAQGKVETQRRKDARRAKYNTGL